MLLLLLLLLLLLGHHASLISSLMSFSVFVESVWPIDIIYHWCINGINYMT
jgi:hypothetical protein